MDVSIQLLLVGAALVFIAAGAFGGGVSGSGFEIPKLTNVQRGISILIGVVAGVVAAVAIMGGGSNGSGQEGAATSSSLAVVKYVDDLRPIKGDPQEGWARTRSAEYQHSIVLQHDCAKRDRRLSVTYRIPSGMKRLIGNLELSDDSSPGTFSDLIISVDEGRPIGELQISGAGGGESEFDVSNFFEFTIESYAGNCEPNDKLKVVFGNLRLTN